MKNPHLPSLPTVALLLLLWATAATAATTAHARSQSDREWQVTWKNGTRVESSDGDFEIRFGGRIQLDFSFADTEDGSPLDELLDDRGDLRRARLFVQGLLYDQVEFKLQYDFASGDARPNDVYVGMVDLPLVGNFRAGHFKEPFSLGALTSSKYATFLERSFQTNAFAPFRNIGLMLHDRSPNERLTWAAGAFKETDARGENVQGEWNLTGRLTGLVLDGAGGDAPLLHLGASASKRSPEDDAIRFSARPPSNLVPRVVDTGDTPTRRADLLGLEAAFVQGPFWASAEWTTASLDAPASADFAGWHAQAGWFLTGERRPFKKSAAVFDRVRPERTFSRGGGPGAWELALRYTELDLDDAEVLGGSQEGVTLAVNWYPNSATRLMVNLARSELGDGTEIDLALLRLAIDF